MLVDDIKDKGFSIDIFVLNAGISQREKGLDTSFDTDKAIMQINYWSSVYIIKNSGNTYSMPNISISQSPHRLRDYSDFR